MLRGSTVDTIQERYSRQVLYPGIGEQGQRRLAAGHVAVVGCGATGAAAAALLARAGVGTLTLIDRDFVEESNLQRQVLFDEADAREALPKAEAARQKIAAFNSQVQVHAHVVDLVPSNIRALLHEAAIILDAAPVERNPGNISGEIRLLSRRPRLTRHRIATQARFSVVPGLSRSPGQVFSPGTWRTPVRGHS